MSKVYSSWSQNQTMPTKPIRKNIGFQEEEGFDNFTFIDKLKNQDQN